MKILYKMLVFSWVVWNAAAGTRSLADVPQSDLQAVMPSAETFRRVEGRPYKEALNEAGQTVGWVALSTDIVSIKGYSGKPIITLVGLDSSGVISGAKVIHHSEPIILLGIPEEALTSFVDFYRGKRADAHFSVGKTDSPDALVIDSVSGATVTVLAENATILDSVRAIGAAENVLPPQDRMAGEFVTTEGPWSFAKMVKEGVFGRLLVTEAQLGISDKEAAFVDLYYTLADAPHIGRPLLGNETYKHLMEKLGEDDHLVVILGNGSGSFKGSGFVRGGIFDRVRLEQKLSSCMFTDIDYYNLPSVAAAGGPDFKEGAVFISRGAAIDPGRPFSLVFLGSFYDSKGAYSREFKSFNSEHNLPQSVFARTGPDPNSLIWRQAWSLRRLETTVLIAFWLVVLGFFIQRSWMQKSLKRLHAVHWSCMTFSFLVLGLWMAAQPSITQVLTLVDAVLTTWDNNLFLSEPLLFVSWIFIGGTIFIWGRGLFCGWMCPFGAMSELINIVAQKLGVKQMELKAKWHNRLRYFRYFVFAGLIPVFLISPELGEKLAEVEPFKTTFFLVPWTRHWGLFAWWLLLVVGSAFTFRPFCRYICPLGAALAIPTMLRRSGPYRRRFCSKCTICTKICECNAIRDGGTIISSECLNCMHCELNSRSDEICPPLIGLKRLKPGPNAEKRRKKLEAESERI